MSDLISRQTAIDAVNTALFPKINTAKDAEKALRALTSAQPEKAQLSQEDTTLDCISRIAVYDRVDRIVNVNHLDPELAWFTPIGVKTLIAELPSAQPEPQWIPCRERLPDEDGDYLALYCTHSKYKPYVCDVISFANDLYQIDEYDFNDKKGQKGWFYCDHEYGYCEDNSVYAWMPLPPVYREEGESR